MYAAGRQSSCRWPQVSSLSVHSSSAVCTAAPLCAPALTPTNWWPSSSSDASSTASVTCSQWRCGSGRQGRATDHPPFQMLVFGKKIIRVSAFLSINTKFGAENPPFWGNWGERLNFLAPVISADRKFAGVGQKIAISFSQLFDRRRRCNKSYLRVFSARYTTVWDGIRVKRTYTVQKWLDRHLFHSRRRSLVWFTLSFVWALPMPGYQFCNYFVSRTSPLSFWTNYNGDVCKTLRFL